MASATTGKARRLVLKPRAFQVYKDGTRFRVLASGRRFGKTFLAADELIKFATRKNGAVCWYVAPTFKMAERIMWVILKNSIPDAWIAKKNETKLMITLINGSTISLCGAENYDALRGSGIDFVVLDEFAFMAVAAWNEVIRPGLSDKEGHALFISSPDGLNHFYDFFKRGVVPSKEWKSWRFSTIEGGWVSAKEIMAAKAELDERTFAQEYLGEFINFAGRVAYNFSESNYDKELFYNPNKPLLIGFDFNNAPGVAAVAQEQNMPGQFEKSMVQGQEISAPITGLGFIGEVWIPKHSNTILVCKKLYEDWQGHAGEVIVYGDASGGNKTAQGVGGSDWDLIKNFFKQTKWADRIKYEVPRANPRIRARINATTSMIRSVDGKIRLMMDAEQCPHIIEDFERLTVIEGTTGEIDKKSNKSIGHIFDAATYIIAERYPVDEADKVTSQEW